MAKRKISSKEYPAKFHDVAMMSMDEYPGGALIEVWPVDGDENAAYVLVHRFNRFRNVLWDEQSPYAVSAKDLKVSKVKIGQQWFIHFVILNLYSRQEKEDGLSGAMRKLDESLAEAQRKVEPSAPGHITLPEQQLGQHTQPVEDPFEAAMRKHGYLPAREQALAVPVGEHKHEWTPLGVCAHCGTPQQDDTA